MILYRPVGLQELELIYDGGMKAFPARLPQQPIFYPVLQLEYARQIASGWNAKNGQLAGYVTQFKVEDQYADHFETHTVGKSQHQELWIPAEEMEEFNKHIVGHIKVVEAHFGDVFEGFVPEKFALQGKNAVEQFTLLANSYLYKRMDFYLEIKRNHKAIFLNYPFWQTYGFKNPGLKEKVLQGIKEAWLTSFPKIPLPLPPPVQEEPALVKQAQPVVDSIQEDVTPVEQKDSPGHAQRFVNPVYEDITREEETYANSLVDPDEEITLDKETDSDSSVNPLQEEHTPEEQPDSHSLAGPVEEDVVPAESKETNPPGNAVSKDVKSLRHTDRPARVDPVHEDVKPLNRQESHPPVHSVHQNPMPVKPTGSHFSRGIELGLSGNYHEAIKELSRAVEEDPNHVSALTSLGVAFHRLGEDERALSCYENALKLDTNNAEAHYFRANILYGHGNIREAIAGYTMAIGRNPELIESHQKPIPEDRLTDYAGSPAEMHRIAKPARRIIALNRSLESHPRQANLFKERAAEYDRLWNYEQAVADYSAALALQPQDASALHSRGVAYEQMGQHDRALEDYRQAIAINPRLADEYLQRGVTFGNLGNLRQSIANLTEGIRLAPENPDGYFNRGTAYFQQGDFTRAIEDFSNVIRLSPGDETAYYWRGICNEKAGRQNEAIADYRQFLATSQDFQAREEVEQKLSGWHEGKPSGPNNRNVAPKERQKTSQVESEKPYRSLDLYDLITALGQRALDSTWLGHGVDCFGESAQELFSLTDQDLPIAGYDLFRIASGIQRTIKGDFQAFDPGATAHWILIRAWEGNGFYFETNDLRIKQRLKFHFQSMEEVEGASSPYEGLFISIP